MSRLLALVLLLNGCATSASGTSYKSLQGFASAYQGELKTAGHRKSIDGLAARLLKFRVDGLEQFALLITPAGPKPSGGWPVVIFNHGYVPVAADHGLRKSTGERDRPGDYYRGIPEEYARHGFLVIAPDFRGHAESEGAEFVRSKTPTRWYTRDVVALVKSVESLSEADESRLFMVGHSMGSAITLNVLSVLGSELKAASLWSTAKSSYFHFETKSAETRFSRISTPLNIHHAVRDPVTPFSNSQAVTHVIAQTAVRDKQVWLYPYPSDHHLIEGEYRTDAFRKDITLFKSLLDND